MELYEKKLLAQQPLEAEKFSDGFGLDGNM